MAMEETLLKIDRGALPSFSARGCTQSLSSLPSGDFRRTVNGELCYLGRPEHFKYVSEIRCQDQIAPAFEGFWRGERVSVACLQRVCQAVEGDGALQIFKLGRPVVPDSLSLFLKGPQPPPSWEQVGEQSLHLSVPLEQGKKAFLSYRPLLHMYVTSFTLETDEWGGKVSWHLTLEEV